MVMCATAIMVFDDRWGLAEAFGRPLDEELGRFQVIDRAHPSYVPYLDAQGNERPSAEVAVEAAEWITRLRTTLGSATPPQRVDRFVFVVDLSPTDDGSHRDYGLRVITQLPQAAAAPYRGSLSEFLKCPNHLTTILSTFLKTKTQMDEFVQRWLPDVRVIHRRPDHEATDDALRAVKGAAPRIVLADRIADPRWLAKLIAAWIHDFDAALRDHGPEGAGVARAD